MLGVNSFLKLTANNTSFSGMSFSYDIAPGGACCCCSCTCCPCCSCCA